MKSIAVLCNYVLKPDRIGGMDRFYKLYDERLKERGCNVDWFFSDYHPFRFYKELTIFSNNNKSVEQLFIEKSKNDGLKYDIIVTHFTQLCTSYYKVFKKLHPSVHIIVVDHNSRPINGFSLKKKIRRRIEGLLYSRYIDQFIGVSKYTFNHILKDYGNNLHRKTCVIYNGIDTSVFKKRTLPNSKKFISACYLRKSKGIQDLIAAICLIDKNLLEDVKIDIYGEGPLHGELSKMIKDNSLDSVIVLKGSTSKLYELYANYSYMILPTYMECFNLSILESLLANVPVITTDVGGNLEVLTNEKNSFIFKPGNIKQLAYILTNIITEKKTIETNVSNKVEEEFYLDKMVSEHINLLPCI